MPLVNNTLYGNNIVIAKSVSHKSSLNGKISNSEDCMIIEKDLSYNHNPKGHGISTSIKVEEEGGHTNTLGTKCFYAEISRPKSDYPNSPLSHEESNKDVSGNGFVTARAKLEMDATLRRGLTGSPSASVSLQNENTNRTFGARTYGVSRGGMRGNFVPPINSNGGNAGNLTSRIGGTSGDV
ncbi:fidgetin-like protein 1 [Tripterygium wilfordii]|uniref:Fidgetin-like protein 1 n=1 Tax=Tripterygium wilfordii TaxID=458696 RepID=A0A7J7D2I8_TRIWF|nr:fidgetin-like protein 1 [Tripterygium wilfordii]